MADVVAIRFTRRAPLCGTTYNAGEVAAFPPHIAEAVIKAGAGVSHTMPTPEAPKAAPEPKKP